jgi:hypothetical protein
MTLEFIKKKILLINIHSAIFHPFVKLLSFKLYRLPLHWYFSVLKGTLNNLGAGVA